MLLDPLVRLPPCCLPKRLWLESSPPEYTLVRLPPWRGLPVGSPMMPIARSVATALMLRTSHVPYCLKLVAQLFNSLTKTNAFV